MSDFIRALEHAGELRRISAPVSPILEISAIADRLSKTSAPRAPSAAARRTDPEHALRGGPALLFENVKGSEFPVLINAWGSYRRMEMALGCAEGGFERIADRIAQLANPQPPRSLGEALARARQFTPLLRIAPKRRRRRGACQEIVRTGADVDLRTLPFIKCWPLDGDVEGVGYPPGINGDVEGVDNSAEFLREFGGRYITLGGVHTIHARDAGDPKPASHNIGMYRVQMLGRRHMAMHWHVHHDGAAHWRSWKELGRPMPVAIALGGESVLPYAATCPLPPGISELLMAGFLNGRGIPLCRTLSLDPALSIPASSEIVIEGFVRTDAGEIGWDPRDPESGPLGPGAVFEGPFGDHTGFYSMPDRYPVLEVTAITHRARPIYPTTIVGQPPQEDYYLGKATERIMLPLLKTILPDIVDYHLPLFGAFHNCAFIKIRKEYPFHARRVMHGVWGAGQMSWTKCIFVVDDDIDVHDTSAVLRAAARQCHPGRDIERVHGPLDILDHAAPQLGAGTKIGFDCTRTWSGEIAEHVGWNEQNATISSDGAERLLARVKEIEGVTDAAIPESHGFGWLLVAIDKRRPGHGRELLAHLFESCAAQTARPPFVIVLHKDIDVHDRDVALFHWVANMSPDRDLCCAEDGVQFGFDSTPKGPGDARDHCAVRAWPPIMEMSAQIKERVESRWHEYGLD